MTEEVLWTDIPQVSDEWHEWRALGLGGSTAPIIMGTSPWSDPRKLFKELTGQIERPNLDFAKRLGDIAEERCASFLAKAYGLDMAPICAERTKPEDSWLRVSLDGACLEKSAIAEYKYANKKDHATTLGGAVPEKYWPQVQYQLFVTKMPALYYVSYWDKADDYACLVVKPDKQYQEQLYNKMKEFWKGLTLKSEPKGPAHETEGSASWCKQVEIVKKASEKKTEASDHYDKVFKKLCDMTKGVVTIGSGARLTRTKGRTTIDWDKIETIKTTKESLTPEELKKITKIGKPSWKLTYLKQK